MQVTIERDINGNPYTLIKRPVDHEWIKRELARREGTIPCVLTIKDGICFLIGQKFDGSYHYIGDDHYTIVPDQVTHTLHALPPLPRQPEAGDDKLLYRYASEGLCPWGSYFDEIAKEWRTDLCAIADNPITEITHCTDAEGNRVEVAIV